MTRPIALAFVLLGLGACSDESFFTMGRDPMVCEDSIPTACGTTARCVLDTGHYLTGDFPSARRFIVHTMAEADLNFEIYLDNRHAPGTSLRLQVSEPSCDEKELFDSAGADIFQEAGEDGIIPMPIHVELPGDHLVELSSDAYCSYVLRFSLQQTSS
ncbi:MAG: hypothetical protein WCG85_05310 [Polyangia bacterium]